MEIKSKLLSPIPETLRSPLMLWSLTARAPSCVTPGKWADLSGPQLPLP